jgi:hypothetical protein
MYIIKDTTSVPQKASQLCLDLDVYFFLVTGISVSTKS